MCHAFRIHRMNVDLSNRDVRTHQVDQTSTIHPMTVDVVNRDKKTHQVVQLSSINQINMNVCSRDLRTHLVGQSFSIHQMIADISNRDIRRSDGSAHQCLPDDSGSIQQRYQNKHIRWVKPSAPNR